MVEPIAGSDGKRKCDSVADAINRLLHNLIIKCARGEGVRNFYDVCVIGYGAQVAPGFSGPLAGRDIVPLSEVANHPARVEERIKQLDDGAGGVIQQKTKFPVWFEPLARGTTPMGAALDLAHHLLTSWVAAHQFSYPPIVINISDGEATDGNPDNIADSLKKLASSDGSVLVFNLHLSSTDAAPTQFPAHEEGLPDKHAKMLFGMSSELPEYMRTIAMQEGFTVDEHARGFVFNADIVSVIQFLDIGTRPSNLR